MDLPTREDPASVLADEGIVVGDEEDDPRSAVLQVWDEVCALAVRGRTVPVDLDRRVEEQMKRRLRQVRRIAGQCFLQQRLNGGAAARRSARTADIHGILRKELAKGREITPVEGGPVRSEELLDRLPILQSAQ